MLTLRTPIFASGLGVKERRSENSGKHGPQESPALGLALERLVFFVDDDAPGDTYASRRCERRRESHMIISARERGVRGSLAR